METCFSRNSKERHSVPNKDTKDTDKLWQNCEAQQPEQTTEDGKEEEGSLPGWSFVACHGAALTATYRSLCKNVAFCICIQSSRHMTTSRPGLRSIRTKTIPPSQTWRRTRTKTPCCMMDGSALHHGPNRRRVESRITRCASQGGHQRSRQFSESETGDSQILHRCVPRVDRYGIGKTN